MCGPVLGVLAGVLVSRGASFMHHLWDKINGMKTSE